VALSGRILLVNGQTETEEVLRAVLGPKGMTVESVDERQDHTQNADQPQPNVIVLHQEEPAQAATNRMQNWNNVPRVVIGAARINSGRDMTDRQQYLQAPFQYGDLIQAVENLLTSA